VLTDLLQIDFLNLSGELVVFGVLLWLGYIGARIVARLRLPAVTGFLVMGIVLGPSVIGFLSEDVLHRLEIVEPVALGVIVFLIGEELTTRMLARHPWQFWMTSILNVVLPAAFVGFAVARFEPNEPALAWVLGTIALSGAPATVMAVITEKRARGNLCDTMLGCAALDNIVCVLAFAVVVPYLQLVQGMHPSVGSALAQTATEVLGAVAIGLLLGWTLAALLGRVSDKSEMLAIALTHVVLAVAIADAIGVSTLLAPLVAGIVTATFEERQDRTRRVFEALRAVEFPVYILFFTIAGANLRLSAVVAGGALVVIYIVARSAGKFAAGFAGGLASGFDSRSSVWFGLGMLPQAGVAVGLALSAATVFPDVGPTINAVVLAAIVFFEILGPVATQRAIEKVATCDVVEGIEADIAGVERATVLVPVSYRFSSERLIFLLHMTSAGRPNARFVLTHIISHDRPVMRAEAVRRGQAILDELAAAGREAGFEIDTRLVESQNIGHTLSDLAEELGASLVVIGSGQDRGKLTRSLLKSRMHRILDEVSAPVLVVPEQFEPLRTDPDTGEPGEPTEAPSLSLEDPPDRPAP
jgi:Kef-type K+ transport system membrane component KefB